ncbi:MAG: metal ABC transporter permease, partial [Planctomycetes bacterium]|nr:metal ABC transporter permease [Planctomycetota bacterium]
MIESLCEAWNLAIGLFFDGFVSLLAIALTAPLIGVLLVLRRMPLLGLAGPQLASCGRAGAIYVSALVGGTEATHAFEPGHGALVAGAVVAVTIGMLAIGVSSHERRFVGTRAGIAFVVAMALQDIFYLHSPPHPGLEEATHHGHLLTVDAVGRDLVLGCCAVTLAVCWSTWRRQWISAFDPDQARLLGLSVRRELVTTLLLVGGFCAVCAPIAGPLSVFTLTLVPPVFVRAASPSLASYAPLSIVAGLLGAVAAFVLACWEQVDWPPGPAVTLCVVASSALVSGILI